MDETCVVPLDSLQLDPNNARLHPTESIDALCASLKRFGQPEPLVVRRADRVVISGNGRLEAMRALGWREASVRLVDYDVRESAAYALTANRTGELSVWDTERLGQQVDDLKVDFDLSGVGFDEASLDGLFGTDDADAAATDAQAKVLDVDALQEPDIPEAPAQPISRRGDVWTLGAHRLMCGDATSPADVATLMGDERASLVFTSPPYDQQRDYGAKICDWDALMRGVFGRLGDAAAPEAQVLVNLGMVHKSGEWVAYWNDWVAWMRAQGWRSFGWYVWDQGHGLPGDWNGRLSPSHEFIFHFNRVAEKARKSKASKWAGLVAHKGKPDGLRNADGDINVYQHAGRATQSTKIPDSVIRVTRHKGSCGGHPAPFAVKLVGEIYAAYSDEGDVCYEPFAGSGTSVLAAEQLGRRCFAMDVEPSYVDIAVARWEKLTGKKATRTAAAAA